jgi:hypothetical protein
VLCVCDFSLCHTDLPVAPLSAQSFDPAPSPRVGTAAATLNGKTYIFSGRGGAAMAPIDEQGAIWCLDHASSSWSKIEPANPSAPVPEPRSYHAFVADNRDELYLHAGCPEKGRLSDLWAFQLCTRRWIQLGSAPGPERGGTSIAFCEMDDQLFRMSGFDGEKEQGGSLDIYSPESDTWKTTTFTPDGIEGPDARSVGSLLCLTVGDKAYLITMFGERDPSSLGHQGAGKMLGDAWAWDIRGEQWISVGFEGSDPPPRGWFASEVLGQDQIVVHGGLAESGSRLDDVWVGKLTVSD